MEFHRTPSGRSRSIPFRRTDMMKLIVAFRSCFEKAPKNKKQTHLKINAVENTRGEAKFLCFVATCCV